ncbi:stAR-related lipid transfer protein 9 [Orycteropus afer afer]|uniref:StAR-related lipid transfer protein 9 n=1 Tax=Orycteropus afer afer TaxID=1230840 RepID=A0A8B6ZHJ5_ORYAF|nr:stAR-related lipid transfer protein 9 [Orycteropus afer afer]
MALWENKDGARIVVEVDGKVAKIRNLKADSRPDAFGDSREKIMTFGFDYCYWSVNPEDPQYASQDVVFQDLGTEVLSGADKGYNICLFAYGQTGSGKTYTMLGTPESIGLTPRICEGLFIREEDCSSLPSSCRIKVSFLEIYNERVRDLLNQSDQKKSYTLRVREHPEMGPYVQGLSQHVVTNYKQVIQLLEEGIANRITAATQVHEASSRSHAIFTIYYTQAILENNLPSEIASKINLVDLAGSERADPSYCKDRITEGANINKSLVTLGIVISTLAQNSQIFSSCQSLSSAASDGGDSGIPSSPSGTSGGGGPSRRQSYIPYRDSVLTWLLKDSLGGNSKTIMVATVSPAHTSYNETMSTLRYASNAKNIINKPRVNEDANVKLIRELREEIERLKAMLLSFELRNFSSLNEEKDENLKELVLQNELKINQLSKDWSQKWSDWKALMEHYSVAIIRRRAGLVIDSSLPHLMALEDDVLSTGVVLYHLKEGTTKIGRIDSDQEQDIVLQGQWIERDHCTITSACGVVVLRPAQGARCTVNGREVTASCRLTQGAVITLGKAQKFRFNHPAEAAALRQRRQNGEAVGGTGSLEWLDLDGDVTASRLGLFPLLWKERRVPGEQCEEDHPWPRDGEASHKARIQQQQCYVDDLRQQILAGQIRAERELEFDQAHINQQIKDNQQWLLREETWLASLQQQQQDCVGEKDLETSVVPSVWLQTDSEAQPSLLVQSQKRVVQVQLLRRHALRAAERNVRRRKATFQLERIIKKQRLLEVQKSQEQLKALCWLQDDRTQEPPGHVPSPDALIPGPPWRSKSTSCSCLGLQRFCSQHLAQPHSVLLNWDFSTTLPPMPNPTHEVSEKTPSEDHLPQAASYPPRTRSLNKNDFCSSGQGKVCITRGALAMKGASAPGTCFTMSPKSASIQERERVGKQPRQKVSQVSASLSQPADKLKPGNDPEALTPTSQSRMAKGLAGYGYMQAKRQKEGNLVTHKAAKGACRSSSHSRGPMQTSGHGKASKTFRAESKPISSSRASKRQQRVLASRVRDAAKKSSHLPHGSPLKRQHSAGDPDIMAPLMDSNPIMGYAGENNNDLSDTNSDYSVDSLSCVCAKVPVELLKPEDPQEMKPEDPQEVKPDLPELENSESDDSQISEDSLAERGYQTQKDSPDSSHPTNSPNYHRAGTRASVRGFTVLSDSGQLAQAHKSFSLDSLIDAEEELGEDQKEELLLGSPEEMSTETFWHLQNSSMSAVDQEARSNSSYLDPPVQLHCGQPESAVEPYYSEKASSLPGTLLSRGSPLMSMDSWFTCDSKINPSNPPGTVGSLCPSPDVQEFQHCGCEKPEYWLNMEEQKPSGAEAVLPYSFKVLHGGTELLDNTRDGSTTPASDTSKLSLCGTHRGADSTDVTDKDQQDTSEASNSSSVSNVLAASAASLTLLGSASERDWSALQQKYLLELSHPVLEARGEFRPAFPCLEEDSGSLAQASGRGGDSLLPVGPGISNNLNFNNFSTQIAKSRHLRAEKEQGSLSVKLEGTSDFFRNSEKKVNLNETSSADLESLASETTNAQVFTAESKIPNPVIETHEVKQKNLEGYSQESRKPGPMISSDEYFFRKNPCHSNGITATKEHHWPQGWMPVMKNTAGQPGQPRYNSHHLLQEGKAYCQESSTDIDISFAFPSDPELYLHSAPWDLFSSSLQPPPLETFYVTKSRDALTETALEIPACRKVGVLSPPLREAWSSSHDHQIPCDTYLKSSVPVLLQNQSSKFASSQQVTAERPVDLNPREILGEIGKCLGNSKKESHNSVYFSVAQNRHLFSSVSPKVCEFENQVGILNKKHSLRALRMGDKATTQSCCSVSSNSSASLKPFFVCESGEAAQGQDAAQNAVLRQSQASDVKRKFPSGASSDFICKTINLGHEKNLLGETTASLKASSPVIVAQNESPTHKWEGKNETGLLGKGVHPKDSSDEFKLPGADAAFERCQTVPSCQERNLSVCKRPGKSQERTKEELSGKKKNKRVNHDDEMARLIRSIMQLEHSILEIESKQNKQLHASHTLEVSKEIVFQDQEKADHVLRPAIPGDHLSFKDQSFSLKQHDNVVLRDSEVREMKELSSCIEKDPQVQSPFKTRQCIEELRLVREPTHPSALESSARDTWDYLGTCVPHREPTNTSLHPKITLPLQPRQERSENEGELLNTAAMPKGKPHDLGSVEELATLHGFQKNQVAEHINSSNQKELKIQSRIEEMAIQTGGSLQEENKIISSTQKFPSPSLLCMSRFFSQETVCPLLSQTDSSIVSSQEDLTKILPLNSSRLPKSYFYAPESIGIFSVDYVLDPTMFKIHDSPLVARVRYQDQSGDTRSHSPQEHVSGITSVAHSAWYGSAVSMAIGSHSQSGIPESISLGKEGRLSARITFQDQGGGLRSTLSTREDFAPETEAATQKEVKRASPLNRMSSQLRKRVSSPLEEDDFQDREANQKAENDAKDLSLTSDTFSAPASLTEVPSPKPRMWEPSSSFCLALLEEVRQAKAQGKQLNDFVARRTVLPYHETLLEPECFSRVSGRLQYKQMDQSVSYRTRNEGKTQGFHVAPLSAEPEHLLTERKVLQAPPHFVENFQLLPNSKTHRGTWLPSQVSSLAAPILGKSHCTGELRHFLGVSGQCISHCSSPEVIEKKKEASRRTSSPGPLGLHCLLSSSAVEEDRRVEPEKVVPALSSQAPSDDPEVIPYVPSRLATCETTDGPLPGESCSEHWELSPIDTTYGGGLENFLVTTQAGKTTCFESQSVLFDVQSSASSLSGPKQDHIQYLESSKGLEERRASSKQGILRPGVLRRVELEDPSQQCVNWKGNVGSELKEAWRSGSRYPEPSSLPDQRPSPDPGDAGERAPSRCPEETLDHIVSGSIEGSRTLSSSWGPEESRALSSLQLCSLQHVASHTCAPHSSTFLCYGGDNLEKRTFKTAPNTVHSPCMVPSMACGMDERGTGHSREPDVLLSHGLKPKGMNMELGPTDCSTLEPSVIDTVFSLSQGCSSSLAPDMRTGSLGHSTAKGNSKSVGDPERNSVEWKPSTEFEAVPPVGMCSEPLRKFQDSCAGGENSRVSQTKTKLPTINGGLNAQNIREGSVENELVVEPQNGYLENTFRCLLEKLQLSSESGDHKFVTGLKHVQSTQVDSPWEEEEQQRDPIQDENPPSSDENGLDDQNRDARTEEEALSEPERFSLDFEDASTVRLEQRGPQPPAQKPCQPCSGRKQLSSHHRDSPPVIAIFSGPKHSLRAPPRPQFSVVSSSRSLQELNLSVEPPSPTDEDIQGPNRLWNSHPKDCCLEELVSRTSLKAEDSCQKASSNLDSKTADHRPLKPATLPYPTSSALSGNPTSDFMASWTPGTLEQAPEGRPEKVGGQAQPEECHSGSDKRMLHFDSSDINPYILPCHPEGPGRIGWKQYVFGSAVDVSCRQTPQGLTPPNVARCSSMDNGLDDQNSPFHSHLSTYANAWDLSSTHSSTENARASNETSEVWGSLFALGDPHTVTDLVGADKKSQFKDPPDEAGLRSKPPFAGGSAAGPVDEILLYPSAADHTVGQVRMGTFERGTQTLGCTDISSATPEASTMSVSHLASWTSMQNLSLHLSRLLHSTSELLGSLSQPSVAEKEQNTKKEPRGEAPQALRMDSCTQTTMDKGSQTDLSSPPVHFQAPEANPQKVNVILEVLGSDTLSQKKGNVPVAVEKREAEETAWKTAGSPDLQEESIHCRPQRPLVPSSHLRFLKDPLGQKLPSVSSQDSVDAYLPPHYQPETSSCLVVSSPSLSISHSPGLFPNAAESVGEPKIQKEKQGLTSALLVDRASSPILTLSASAQGSSLPPGSSSPSAQPLEGHQKLESSSDLPLDTPVSPMDDDSQPNGELDDSQRPDTLCGEGRNDGRSFLELSSLGSPQQRPELQVSVLGQPPQHLQPRTTQVVPTWEQRNTLPPPPVRRSSSWRLAKSLAHGEMASSECDSRSSRGPTPWQSRMENGAEGSACLVESQPTLDVSSPWGDIRPLSPCLVSELTDTTGIQDSILGPVGACQPKGLLSLTSQLCIAPEPSPHSLRDLPVHNKFSNWCGVQDDSPGGLAVTKELGIRCDLCSGDQGERPPHVPEDQSLAPEWPPREQIPLQVGAQNLSLSMELTEAKLHHGFGKADALLQVLQSGTGEALAADEPVFSTWEERYTLQKKAIQTLRRERAERLQNFCRTRSLSPQKQLSLLPNMDFPTRDLDLPSRRREYLQKLRKDVVETTRSSEAVTRSAHPPSDIKLMLQNYQRAREEAKVEIARARDRLREQTEQEKLRIRQQIISQLLREEEQLHTLANSSPLCTSSNGSLSSGITSGYNSNPALSGQLQSPDSLVDTHWSDSRDTWIGDGRGRSAVRSNRLYGHRAFLGSCCCSTSSLTSSATCCNSSYQDLAKHIVNISVADVMAACSDNLHNLFIHQAAAGWSYQGEEQEVQLYYKVFSSTRHGFLGAGVVSQPLPQVWTAVSDPTLWPLYHKPIQTARLHQRVTNSISLVYLVCNTTLCALKQPRDFCCVCVEAKEGHLFIMAAQSVYDISMPRPSREMVRGEILPSAWILQPLTMEGKEITRVIYLAQVELGAPGFPPQLLNSFIKQQPLVIARLASFLSS